VENKHDLENGRDHLHAPVIVGLLLIHQFLFIFYYSRHIEDSIQPCNPPKAPTAVPYISPHSCQLTALLAWIEVITGPNDDNGMGKKSVTTG
jgi:hypothetical protein